MKTIRTIYFPIAIIATLLLFGCSSDDSSNGNKTPPERTFEDVEKDFSELEVKEGISDYKLDVPSGLSWNFRVIAPDVSDGIKKPLFVNLHGAAGGDPNAHKTTSCYVEPGLENIEAFVISPNGGTSLWQEPINQSQVVGLVTLAIKYWDIDPNKVVVMGYSNGGNGSWFFAETQPELFSAGIPMASSYSTIGPNGQPRKIDTPLYVIHGENDELFPLAETQAWVDQSIEAGSSIEFIVAPGLTHNEPCEYVPYLRDAIEWLNTSVW